MITRKLLYIHVIVLTFIIPHFIHASHIRAGEVIARRTSNFSNLTFEYEFTFIGYRDTDTNIEFGGGEFDFGDGTVISGDFNVLEAQITATLGRLQCLPEDF